MHKILYCTVVTCLLLIGCDPSNPHEDTADSLKENPLDHSEVSMSIEREPVKEFVQSIEGEEETIRMNLVEGKNARYSMYVDTDRYHFKTLEDMDILTPVHPLPESYPVVKLEIRYMKNLSDEAASAIVKEELEKNIDFTLEKKTVTSPVTAISLHGTSGVNSDSQVLTVYVLNAGENGCLVLIETYFLEAQEGHGARFQQMLETLKINQ